MGQGMGVRGRRRGRVLGAAFGAEEGGAVAFVVVDGVAKPVDGETGHQRTVKGSQISAKDSD